MKQFLVSILILVVNLNVQTVFAQSATTQALWDKNQDALTLFFYNNTLRMLNQNEDKEFDELIKDIEKMRFLMIRKKDSNFSNDDFRKLRSQYQSEAFEEIMTTRHDGKNFDVFLKENNGKRKGMLVLVNEDDNLFVLDIQGSIPLDKVTRLWSELDESADIGKRIKAFAGDDDDDEKPRDSQ